MGIFEGSTLYAPNAAGSDQILISDESSLPAIWRISENASHGTLIRAIIETAPNGHRPLLTAQVTWVDRGTHQGSALASAVRAAEIEADIGYAWLCAERTAVRSIRRHLAVLPQQTADVLTGIDIPAEKTLVSAVAGVSTAELGAHLPNAPTIVRIIPLPAVRQRTGVTAMYPANEAVKTLLDALGGSVTATSETLFGTLSAVTATMSAHFSYLQTITDWLVGQGWNRAAADHFIRGQYVGLGTTLARTDDPIADLVAAHETPGGLNEMLNREWMDEDNRAALAASLDRVFARVNGEG